MDNKKELLQQLKAFDEHAAGGEKTNTQKKIAIPERFDIFQQDLTKNYLSLQYFGFVLSITEARTMCRVLNETDIQEVKAGHHTYIFMCGEMQGEK